MTNDFQKDARQARRDFELYGRNMLERFFGSKQIFSTEKHQSPVERALDVACGVDCLVVDKNGHLHGVSNRFQHGHDYSAFSIRRSRTNGKPTEFEKDLQAMKDGSLVVDYSLHVFISDDGRSAIGGIAPKADLIEFCVANPESYLTNRADGSTFFTIPWHVVKPATFSVQLPF